MDKVKRDLPANVALFCGISTAHITEKTDALLKMMENRRNSLPIFFPKRIDGLIYGYIFVVPEFDDEELSSSWPKDLLACLRYAASLGCDLLIIDGECDVVPELPIYDW